MINVKQQKGYNWLDMEMDRIIYEEKGEMEEKRVNS